MSDADKPKGYAQNFMADLAPYLTAKTPPLYSFPTADAQGIAADRLALLDAGKRRKMVIMRQRNAPLTPEPLVLSQREIDTLLSLGVAGDQLDGLARAYGFDGYRLRVDAAPEDPVLAFQKADPADYLDPAPFPSGLQRWIDNG